ncbi:3-beta hydroxysteroid dehydrogenase isomerase family [Mycena kentingensis (nom. inval.)]|nr:3-beta hydroxysteroid dehydrogenase isomerase family [Mycena kentingensis (nom. inval.)]
MAWTVVGGWIALSLALVALYIWRNDRCLTHIPERASAFSPTRLTSGLVEKQAEEIRARSTPISVADQIPPRTGRRYIVIGGAGFLGGWIVVQLLERGEDPKRIRVLDIQSPTRPDLKTGRAAEVHFIKCDISNRAAVFDAFHAPWPASEPTSETTIFHTAANIRFYEKRESLLPASAAVNVQGMQNILDAGREIGASVMVSTSSGSVSIRSTRFLLWPWESEPHLFVQPINEDDSIIPTRHEQFFSNYAATKFQGEERVRAADKTPSGSGLLRTGVLRPGNGVFGPGGDMLCGAFLLRKVNPTWLQSIVQNFVYVENCALAHLLYEQRLIELSTGGTNPDIGGQAFVIADPCPPPTYGDVYLTLSTLMDGETLFPFLSPTLMILVAHLIEWYYLATKSKLLSFLPRLSGDLVNLQPSLFNLVSVHLIFDDSKARLPPEKGGLGYKGGWTTFEGLYKTVDEHRRGTLRSEQRSDVAGISLGFGLGKAQRGMAKVNEKIKDKVGVDPALALGKT